MNAILTIALNPAVDISCTAQTVKPIHKIRTKNQKSDPGGGGTNVARVISVLGGQPVLAYLSGGTTGPMFESLLVDSAIVQYRFEMQGPVRVAYMIWEETTGAEYRFVPEGPEVSIEEIEPLMKFVGGFDGRYCVASGSLPPGLPTDTYARIANTCSHKGTRLVLDTSGEALQEAFAHGGIYLAKPSRHELEVFAGHRLDGQGLRDVAAMLVAKGAAKNLVVSLGADGALLANEDAITHAPSMKVKVRSAVGAGDSFVGAMTWWLSLGKSVAESFRFGLAAGAAAAMTPGTGLCRQTDVLMLFDRLKQQQV